jgi:hypothetical protein
MKENSFFPIVSIDPVIDGKHFGIPKKQFENVILAPRHLGYSLYPANIRTILGYPICVYVCVFRNDQSDQKQVISAKDLNILFIGNIYRRYSKAIKSLNQEEINRFGYI